jgi:hypothetical protein
MNMEPKITDSIPRVSIEQVLQVTVLLARSGGKTTFDQVRRMLQHYSKRRVQGSQEAMWTVARDALADLQRLEYCRVGILPRKRSEVTSFMNTPCELTELGEELARLFMESRAQAYDLLLLKWMNSHPYFRVFMARLLNGPLFVPDVTSVQQVSRAKGPITLTEKIIQSCGSRLRRTSYPAPKLEVFSHFVTEFTASLEANSSLDELDNKRWLDTIEDSVVLPALLKAEGLPFDHVTFQHLTNISQSFFSAAWTSSYPDFEGRVIFATCEFRPLSIDTGTAIEEVIHHGTKYACKKFPEMLRRCYSRLAKVPGDYVDAYSLRAMMCLELTMQPQVFEFCLEEVIQSGSGSGMTIYTELPFSAPPLGETYIKLGPRRIGLIKVDSATGG